MPIFDQGYQHWQGTLSGHTWRWLAITRHGVRVQIKNRILRFLILLAWIGPAMALVGFVALWGLVEQKSAGVLALLQFLPPELLGDAKAFRPAVWTLAYSYFFMAEMYFIMLIVVVAGPGLISRDLRFNALPLYLARPVTRLDYFLGKLGVIGVIVGMVAVGPAVFAYVVGICFCLDLSVIRDTYRILLGSIAYGLVITLSIGLLILAMSSLTRRSLYVGITWAGMWIISGVVGPTMTEIHRESLHRGAHEEALRSWVEKNPPPQGVQLRNGLYPIGMPVNRQGQSESERWYRAWSNASSQAWMDTENSNSEALRSDWRPLLSFVANLDRMSDLLLDTDTAWVTIGRAIERPQAAFGRLGPGGFGAQAKPPPVNERRLADRNVAQFPWTWSAGVLLGLMGISAWILTRRVKSLDRLR